MTNTPSIAIATERMPFSVASVIPFVEFTKIARLSRACLITEKIDGTNATIYIGEDGQFLAGSRTRWITPQDDNHGFAAWAQANRDELLSLGAGTHRGEWWGSGINRGYGRQKGEKRFSLFNVSRWCLHGHTPQRILMEDPRIEKFQDILPACCQLVPLLYSGVFTTEACDHALACLKANGSSAAPGYTNPEGIVVFHSGNHVCFKKTIEKDAQPKSRT